MQPYSGTITPENDVAQDNPSRTYLPELESETPPEDLDQEVILCPLDHRTILFVEDDEAIRELGANLLQIFGYKVLCASDGEEALQVYDKEQENISLIILDVFMPKMDGKQCLKELLRINPAVKVIVCTGLPQDETAEDVRELGAMGLVTKPYEMKKFLQAVHDVIGLE